MAIAIKFASEGYDVAICGRNEEKLRAANEAITKAGNGVVLALKCDVRDREQIREVAKTVLAEFGSLEVLVNNAGVFLPGKMSEEAEENFEVMMETNLYSNYYMVREFLTMFKSQQKGSIFNICSTASKEAYPSGGSYCVSKHGQLGLTKVLRKEMIEHGVRVTAVMPGATLTDSWAGTDVPEERFMMAEDIAEAIFDCHQLPLRTVVEEIQLRPQLGDI